MNDTRETAGAADAGAAEAAAGGGTGQGATASGGRAGGGAEADGSGGREGGGGAESGAGSESGESRRAGGADEDRESGSSAESGGRVTGGAGDDVESSASAEPGRAGAIGELGGTDGVGGSSEAGAGAGSGAGEGTAAGDGAAADGGAGGGGTDEGAGGGSEGRPRAAAVPVDSGAALTGKAAELLAAVRAVERGERDAAMFFPAPARPPAPRPARSPEPTAGPGPGDGVGVGARPGVGVGAGAGVGQGEPVRPPEPSAAAVAAVRQLLAGGAAPEALASRVAGQFGDGAAEVLRTDPWQLLTVPGVRPSQADEFARGLLESAEPGDERRVEALVGWLLTQAALRGHTALEFPALAEALSGYGVPNAEEALRDAASTGGVLVFEEREEPPASAPAPDGGEDGEEGPPVRLLLGLERYAMAEESLADGLSRLVNTFSPPAGSADGDRDELGAYDASARAAGGTSAQGTPAGTEPGPHDAGGPTGRETGARPVGTDEYGTAAGTASGPYAPGGPRGAGAEPAGAPGPYDPRDSDTAVRAVGAAAWGAVSGAAPSPSAAELIRAAAGNGLVLHTGGEAARAEPAALVAAARALGLRAYAAAHTDDGRTRLAALLAAASPAGPAAGPGDPTPPPAGPEHGAAQDGPARDDAAPGAVAAGGPGATAPPPTGGHAAGAVTVRGLLSGREGPGRDADGLLGVDVLAVLDAPQLDVEVAAALVEALPDGARLVLSGDPGLLESAGPGRVFADVAAARVCPRVTSRTPDPGPIGELVSGVGAGELQAVAAPGKEVVIVPVQDPGEAVHRTVQLVADSVPRALGVPAAATQVIAVGHGGAAGTRVLNAALKERLNPGPGAFGGFDAGDRVVYVPAPGTAVPGLVTSGDDAGLHLDCGGTAVVVRPDRVGEAVRHGWALTAHQAVGRRWPAAVVVVPGDAESALSRAWAYTAFSRGERHLSVVHGAGPVLARRLAEVPAPRRTTRLRGLLDAQTRD